MNIQTLMSLLLLGVYAGCQNTVDQSVHPAPAQSAVTRIVEVSCGQCQLGLPGDGCDLAIRIDGVAYFVDGTTIDDHGDAHADDGLCNCVRKAEATGTIKDGRFVATSLELLASD